jgi:hypothetical protein
MFDHFIQNPSANRHDTCQRSHFSLAEKEKRLSERAIARNGIDFSRRITIREGIIGHLIGIVLSPLLYLRVCILFIDFWMNYLKFRQLEGICTDYS